MCHSQLIFVGEEALAGDWLDDGAQRTSGWE
jgi:hypothetical protein